MSLYDGTYRIESYNYFVKWLLNYIVIESLYIRFVDQKFARSWIVCLGRV